MSNDPLRDLEVQLLAAAQRQTAGARTPWARGRSTRRLLLAIAATLLLIVPSVAAVTGVWTVLQGSPHPAAFPTQPGVSATSAQPSAGLVAVLDSLRRAQTAQDRSYSAQQAVKLQGALLHFSGRGSVELPGVRLLHLPGAKYQFFLIPVRPPAGQRPAQDFVDIQAVDSNGRPPIGVPGQWPPPLPNGATPESISAGQALMLEGTDPRRPAQGPPHSQIVWLVPSGVARVDVHYPRRGATGRLYPSNRTIALYARDNVVMFDVDRNADDAAPSAFTWYDAHARVIRSNGQGGQ